MKRIEDVASLTEARRKKILDGRAYYAKNIDTFKKKNKEKYALFQEERKKQSREYYNSNKEDPDFRKRVNLSSRKSYFSTREKSLAWQKEHHKKLRIHALSVLGGVCVICGFTDWRALQIDHINGDGYLDKKKGGRFNLVKHPELINKIKHQILCANCNFIKRYENQEHRKRGKDPFSI